MCRFTLLFPLLYICYLSNSFRNCLLLSSVMLWCGRLLPGVSGILADLKWSGILFPNQISDLLVHKASHLLVAIGIILIEWLLSVVGVSG